ncbi:MULTISPECIES: hypothetical protein [Pantoea]|uniref:hypothetical protein n=1 Tax=Pantoea TaxID=53335 RepID=UPI0012668E02|nr:hypothetical protein [Pantoea dispersa]MBK4772138.1 hypothetical protein [Pantoea sp. Morm]MEB5970476.1 hypothetical protein [Pantoea dispersa]QFS61531.1 hypothetical protein GAY20_15430 [Pantoea dispersa]UYV56476.1 hypothetical protein OH655_13525 [Pantoea dispersa]
MFDTSLTSARSAIIWLAGCSGDDFFLNEVLPEKCKTPDSGIASHFANAQLELKSLIFPFAVTLAPPGLMSTE